MDQKVSKVMLRRGYIEDMKVKPPRFAGILRCPENQKKRGVKKNSQGFRPDNWKHGIGERGQV